jgi:Inner centromere protein, ARK binding region
MQDGPTKSLFPNGYATAPQPSHAAASLHKATLNAQHMHKVKPAHPMDMAQNSKAPITFAPNPAQVAGPPYKTPARPAGPAVNGIKSNGKPSARSSPRYQNGDSIDLPEIPTDSEDEDSDDEAANNFPVPHWANSPALNQGLILQEGMDPVSVFGLPGEIKLEEVFKNVERHPRFRARTSSANWSGSDRLTEDEVKRDLEARDRLRREGGWSYGLS